MPAMDKVTFTVEAQWDDTTDYRGNAMCSGDEDLDKEVEEEIRRRIDDDVWAWALVKVSAVYGDFEGHDWLGGCSYKDEADFRQPGGYFDDMKKVAFEALLRNIKDAIRKGQDAEQALADLEN